MVIFGGLCGSITWKNRILAIHALAYGTPVITHDDLDRQMPEVEVISEGLTGAFFKHGDVADLAENDKIFVG